MGSGGKQAGRQLQRQVKELHMQEYGCKTRHVYRSTKPACLPASMRLVLQELGWSVVSALGLTGGSDTSQGEAGVQVGVHKVYSGWADLWWSEGDW